MRSTVQRALFVLGLWLLIPILRVPTSPLATQLSGFLALIVILVLPGWALLGASDSRGAGDNDRFDWISRPAEWLTLSVGSVGVLGLFVAIAGGSLSVLIAGCASWTVFCTLLPAAEPALRQVGSDQARPSAERRKNGGLLAAAVVIAVALACAWMAAGGDNIARDRMWYMAYVTSLSASPGPIDWSEPILGSGRVVARFAYNGWILTLAVLARLSGLSVPHLFERLLPPLLAALVPSAGFALGRGIFKTTTGAALVAACTAAVVLTTRFPFFSPENYAGFGRLVEDKSVALLVLSPILLGTVIAGLTERRPRDLRAMLILLLVAASVALTHAIVYLLAMITAFCFAALRLIAKSTKKSTVSLPDARALGATVVVVAILLLASIVPAGLGWQARKQITDGVSSTVGLSATTDPVVRSHLRMDRLRTIPRGGPITEPRLLLEPLLLIALLGLLPAWRARRATWGLFALSGASPMLLLAFTPYLAPAFGRLVVPWMAYRVLWGIPFGVLLTGLLLELPWRRLATLLVIAGLLANARHLPWQRILPGGEAGRSHASRVDRQTRELLEQLMRVPARARIAAAAGLAELIPAYTGHPVLAFSDRGTTVFAQSRREATRRLEANALLIGMHGLERRLRSRIVGFYDVAYTVYEGRHCDRGTAGIFRNARFSLCAERQQSVRRFHLPIFTAVAPQTAGDPVVAGLGRGLVCSPSLPGKRPPVRLRWQRPTRWSGSFPLVVCRASLAQSARVLRLRVTLHLPRAHELLLYRIAARSKTGGWRKKRGGLEFRDNPSGEIAVPGHRIDRLRLRLVPTYLPYLNLVELQLLAPNGGMFE